MSNLAYCKVCPSCGAVHTSGPTCFGCGQPMTIRDVPLKIVDPRSFKRMKYDPKRNTGRKAAIRAMKNKGK